MTPDPVSTEGDCTADCDADEDGIGWHLHRTPHGSRFGFLTTTPMTPDPPEGNQSVGISRLGWLR